MSRIKKYTKKDGSIAYMVKAYLGYDLVTGKQKQTTKRGFLTTREAKLYLANLELEVEKNGIPSSQNTTYKNVFDEWYGQHRKQIKPSTQKFIKVKFNRILPKFGHLKIKNISTSYCQQVVNEWSEELKSFKDYKIQANLVFKYAYKMGYIYSNPMDKITMPKQKEEFLYADNEQYRNFYTRDELNQFLNSIKDQSLNYTFFHVIGYTGARKGEILALNWSDIDFEEKTLRLNKTLYFENNKYYLTTTKSKKSNRIISLDDRTLTVLKKWRKTQIQQYLKLKEPFLNDSDQPVFTKFHPFKRSMTYIRKSYFNEQLKRIYKNNSHLKQITIHGFRHTHASLLFESGAEPFEVQDRLGHEDIQTTYNIYTHVTNKSKEKTAQKFLDFMTQN